MGDIACGTCLYRYFEMGLKVEKPENVLAWYERLSRRLAFQNNIMVPFGELKGRLNF
jgi:glutathione S-transferase